MSKRGWVWILIGVGLLIYNLVSDTPLVLRGTHLPYWPFPLVIGVVFLLIDLARAKKTPPPT